MSNTLEKVNRTTVECLHVDGEVDDVQVVTSEPRQAQDSSALALLVWKYFEEDIRSTLLEIQEVLAADEIKPRRKTRARKKDGK